MPLIFDERLVAQRKEREMATAELGFKKPLSKEEKIVNKKERLAAIEAFPFAFAIIYGETVNNWRWFPLRIGCLAGLFWVFFFFWLSFLYEMILTMHFYDIVLTMYFYDMISTMYFGLAGLVLGFFEFFVLGLF